MLLTGNRILLFVLVAFSFNACVEQEPDRPTAADWKTIKANILTKEPAPKFKVNADFEGKVEYLGLDVDVNTIIPGKEFTLTHYWRVKKAIPGWKVFVHLQDPRLQGRYFINADHKPIQGRYPATMWKVGEIIRDVHKVTLKANWDQPKVSVFVGLWKGQMRMKPKGKQDKKNRLIAATLNVAAKAAKRVAPQQIIAFKTKEKITLDGKLDEAIWKKAKVSTPFVNTLTGAKVAVKTDVKVAYDDKNLYFAFTCSDNDIWGQLKKRDDKLWTQEAVEIFIDANRDRKDYIELQVNPLGTIFDSYLPAYRKNDNSWNCNMKAAVSVDGTVNKRDDQDKGWTVEVMLPLADAKGKGSYELKLPPKLGERWYVNFFRMDIPKKKPQQAYGWSAPLVGDFHKLDRFGVLAFGDEEGKLPKVLVAKPKENQAVAPAAKTPVPVKVKALKNRLRMNLRKLRMKKKDNQK